MITFPLLKLELAEESRIANAEWADVEAFITDIFEDDLVVGPWKAKIQENARFIDGEKRDLRKGIKIRLRGKVVNKVLLAQIVSILEK